VSFLQWTCLTIRRIGQTVNSNMFHMSIVACREGFVILKVVWLYFVSGTSVENYVTNRVSCVKSHACTCHSDSKSVQTYTVYLFSARTRTWTRLVVDTVRGNMSVEHKHRELCDKLYTYMSSHEKIFMRIRPCKTKSCAEGPLFTVNTHHSPSRRSNQCSQTWFRMWKVAY